MARVLVVDDEVGLRLSMSALLKNDGHDVLVAQDVRSALVVLEQSPVDVVISDIIMPGESGVEFLAQVRERDPSVAVILFTGEPCVETASEALRQGAFDYLAKPVSKAALLAVVARAAQAKARHDLNVRLTAENEAYRASLEAEVATRTAQLSNALRGTIRVVADMLDTRDPYTGGHQRSVARLAAAIAGELDLSGDDRDGVEMAAIVHDIGKIGVPAEILTKPSRLSPTEFSLVKEHARIGFEILRKVEFPWPIADIILQHHERLDGSGYPQGLRGDAVRIEARILGVADVVEAMSSHRPYRPALGTDAALDEVLRNRDRLYDAAVVDACVRLFRDRGFTLP
jgi:putative nucleotidyltransferase with HDIG domain